MKIRLSADEMLAQWKLRRGFAPLRADCEISRSDGVDLDAILRLEMRDWYLNLLCTAPIEMLATTNIANDIALSLIDNGDAIVILPENCRRIVEFQLEGWEIPARIITDPNSLEALLQQNPYSRGNSSRPIVVQQGSRLHVYSLPQSKPYKIVRAIAVMEPHDGSYEMDEAALQFIEYPLKIQKC